MYCKRDDSNEMMTAKQNPSKGRLTIRVAGSTLSFSLDKGDATSGTHVAYEDYPVNNGISMAANLREAFKMERIKWQTGKAQLLVGTKVLMMPLEQFAERDAEALYRHAFPSEQKAVVVWNVLADLNAIALFSVNKDLRMVVTDHFDDVKVVHLMTPVWRALHQRSYTGHRQKLYCYFHDKQMDVFAFRQNRFKFCNVFDTNRTNDSLYYLLSTWKELGLQAESDELHIAGEPAEPALLKQQLRRYLQNVYFINPTAEFNNAPITQIEGLPFDLMTLYTRGR